MRVADRTDFMVSITIVTWNSEKYLSECFAALARQDYRDIEVIVVDNASEDGTRALLDEIEQRPEGGVPQRLKPGPQTRLDGTPEGVPLQNQCWRVIHNDKNVGFAAGQNQAIRASRGEWVLCLNPDVIMSTDFVSQLVAAGEAHPDAGSLCGKLLRWDPARERERTDHESVVPRSADGVPKDGSYRGTTSVVPTKAQEDQSFSPCTNQPQGLEPISSSDHTARLKPCPDTKPAGEINYDSAARDPQGLLYPNLNGTSEGVPLQDTAQRFPPQIQASENASPVGDDPHKTYIIDSTGIYFTPNMRHLDRGAEEIDRGQYDRAQYVFGASGAAAFFRRDFIDDVAVEGEFFDEDFFAFREDGDLAWRAQLMGWKCLYTPNAVAWHVRRVTPERRKDLPLIINWHSAKNRFLMRGKNASGWLCRRLFFPVLWRDIMTFGYAMFSDRRLWSAVIYWWKVRDSIRRKRAIIQSRRRISDRDLLWWFSNTPRAIDADKITPGGDTERQRPNSPLPNPVRSGRAERH